jgi:tetratricopeptide (TPR) repeat protein
MLALISNNIANLLAMQLRFAQALPMARRAVAGYVTLTQDQPKVLDYAEGMVMSRITLGQVLFNLGSKEEALNVLSVAAAAAEILVSSHEEKPLFLQRLIGSKTELAIVEASLGRLDGAVATLESASRRLREAVAMHPNSAEFRRMFWENVSTRADILLKHGRPTQAVEGLENLSGEPCPEGRLYYNVACLYIRATGMTPESPHASAAPAREARIRNYNDRAIDLLRKAVATGFRDAKHFAQDRDLDPLRNRPDFQLLMMDVAFPAQPFAR